MKPIIMGEKIEGIDYQEREGVYGIVKRGDEIAVVSVRDTHFLIGGGIEDNESLMACLHREFIEEVGYSISNERKIGLYVEYHQSIRTQVYYKFIAYVFEVTLDRKVAEGIEDDHKLTWIHKDTIDEKLLLAYQKAAAKTIFK